MGLFHSFKCPYCGATLPADVHYKNFGLVKIWCERCRKPTYINKKEIVKDIK